jgi:hypothetical protein
MNPKLFLALPLTPSLEKKYLSLPSKKRFMLESMTPGLKKIESNGTNYLASSLPSPLSQEEVENAKTCFFSTLRSLFSDFSATEPYVLSIL